MSTEEGMSQTGAKAEGKMEEEEKAKRGKKKGIIKEKQMEMVREMRVMD
jgi:hypothetical protein